MKGNVPRLENFKRKNNMLTDNRNFEFEEEEDDDEEEWFYDSIKRYKQLHMFDFEYIITHVELVSPTSICVVGRSGRNDIMELRLPQKLTVAPDEKGMVKNSDLKMLNGGFTVAPVTEMKVFPKKRKVIVSEEHQYGATIYCLGEKSSGLITRTSHVSCELLSPYIALNGEEKVLLSSTSKHQFVIADVETNKIVMHSSLDGDGSRDGDLQPCFVSSNVAAFCERTTGNILLQDIRNNKCLIDNAQINKKSAVRETLWTLTSSWNSENNCENSKLCLASNTGSLFVYDVRNAKHALCEGNVQIPTQDSQKQQKVLTLHFHPKDDTKLSLSGFNENVYILNVSDTDSFKTIFVHNGHGKQLEPAVDSTVTTHIWYEQDIVISASQDKWLHCWQFVTNQT